MAKNSITDYSNTAASNTDIQSVDIDEGCLPSGINNAIREIMADLADVNDGTVTLTSPSFAAATITGDLTVNGSSQTTSLLVNTGSTAWADANADDLIIRGADVGITVSSSTTGRINFGDATSSTKQGQITYTHSGDNLDFYTATNKRLGIAGNGDISFYEDTGTTAKLFWDASAESLGIGTSSPTLDLSVDGDIWQGNGGGVELGRVFNDAGVWHMRASGNVNGLALGTNNTGRMRIDSSGNIMLAKISTNTLGTVGHDFGVTGYAMHTRASSNVLYLNRTTSDGNIVEFYKDGTTVGVIGTQNWGIGTTSPDANSQLHIKKTGANAKITLETDESNDCYINFSGATSEASIGYEPTTNAIVFANAADGLTTNERMRINDSGNVGIGETNPATRLEIRDATPILQLTDSLDGAQVAGHDIARVSFFSDDTSGIGPHETGFILNESESGGTSLSGALVFGTAEYNTAATERMRITRAGNVGIGGSPDTKFHVEEIGAVDLYATFENSNSGGYGAFVDIKSTANFSFARFTGGTKSWIVGQRGLAGGAFSIYDQDNSAHRLVIDSSGSFSFGTATTYSHVRAHFKQDTTGSNDQVINAFAGNAGFVGDVIQALSARASGSGASNELYTGFSGSGADKEFRVRGDGVVAGDNAYSVGADYAEYFEWDDANSSNEDRRGYSVVLTNGNKIRKATSSDATSDIIGVISGHPSVVGDTAWNMWSGKYNRDDFGGYITEDYSVTEWTEVVSDGDDIEHSYHTDRIPSDVTAPADAVVTATEADGTTPLKRRQLNSSYDETNVYTPREERQEWDAVGLMGKLRLRVGQPTGDRWIKMRDIATDDDGNVTVEEWLVR